MVDDKIKRKRDRNSWQCAGKWVLEDFGNVAMGHRTGITVHQGAMAAGDSDDTVTGVKRHGNET